MRGPSLTSSATETISDTHVLGVSDITFSSISKPIHLCFGDPDSAHPDDVAWESLHCGSKAMLNDYEFSIDLRGPVGRRNFRWKRTGENGSIGVMSMVAMNCLDLKMVDVESKDVVARFVQYPWWGSKRGWFLIEEGKVDMGQGWDGIVLLSGMAVLEYMRKMSGWSY